MKKLTPQDISILQSALSKMESSQNTVIEQHSLNDDYKNLITATERVLAQVRTLQSFFPEEVLYTLTESEANLIKKALSTTYKIIINDALTQEERDISVLAILNSIAAIFNNHD